MDRTRRMRVRHDQRGWLADTGCEQRGFTSGSEAERWARRQARLLSATGEDVVLEVFDLAGLRIGAIQFDRAGREARVASGDRQPRVDLMESRAAADVYKSL